MAVAVGAPTQHREVMWVDGEPEPVRGLPSKIREHRFGDLDERSALFANEVAVNRTGQVVGGGAMTEMRVDHQAELFEVLEVAIDRRQMDIGRLGVHLGGKFLRSAMTR